MASNIDPTVPSGPIAFTADVRRNFASAKSEIEGLQTLFAGGWNAGHVITVGANLVLSPQGVLSGVASSAQHFLGGYNATTNTPALGAGGTGAGSGVVGNTWVVMTAGTVAVDGVGPVNVSDQIVNSGSLWQRLPFSAAYGSMAVQNANSVAISGGFASGLSYVSILGGGTLSANALTPDVAYSWQDLSGNSAGWIGADGTFHFGTLTANGGFAAGLSYLSILNGGTVNTGQMTPDVAYAWQDQSGNSAGWIGADGVFHIGSVAVGTQTVNALTVTGPFNVATVAPSAMVIANGTFGTGSTLLPTDILAVETDPAGNVYKAVHQSGGLIADPARHIISNMIQQTVRRSYRLTQGAPTFEGSSPTADAGTSNTYHLCCTLDGYFDAVRLLIPSFQSSAGQSIKVCVAPSATPNDYINPLDGSNNPVPWIPVTFNNAGADIDLPDQGFSGAAALALAVTTTSAATTLVFSSGLTVAMVGAPIYGPRCLQSGTIITAVNVGTQTATISPPLFNSTDQPTAGPGVTFYVGVQTGLLPNNPASPVQYSMTALLTDWIPCSALVRSDGGTWPLLMVRVQVTGTAMPMVGIPSGQLHTGFSNVIGDRIWSCYSGPGDFVSYGNQGGFVPGADNGKSMVFAVQFLSRTPGVTTFGVGDSVGQGFGAFASGIGALALSHMRLSSLACPITQIIVPNGWLNSGQGIVYYPTAKVLSPIIQPGILFLQSWSRNNFLTTLQFTPADADWQWLQNLMLIRKASLWGAVPLIFQAWPNSTMTAATDAYRVGNNTRATQMAAAGAALTFNMDALVGTGATGPAVLQAQYTADGLHLNQAGQEVAAASMSAVLKGAIGR